MPTLVCSLRFLYLCVVTAGAVFTDCVTNPKWLLSLLSEALVEILCAVPALVTCLMAAVIAIVVSVIRKSCDNKVCQFQRRHFLQLTVTTTQFSRPCIAGLKNVRHNAEQHSAVQATLSLHLADPSGACICPTFPLA